MSLDKAIAAGKEHRKGYAERGKPGRYDRTCRPRGGGYAPAMVCTYCERNRLFRHLRRVDSVARTQEGWDPQDRWSVYGQD